jgi:hypothetical protein
VDELDVKRALRGYVTADVPPFNLTASDLVAQGRRRDLWRAGWASLGSAGMAGIIAFGATSVLSPRSGPDLVAPQGPLLNVTGCDRPLPVAGWPNFEPSIEPSIEPTVEPSIEPSVQPATPAPSLDATSVAPSLLAASAASTLYPYERPSGDPTMIASNPITDLPVEERRWPSVPPEGPLPDDPDPARVEKMACYVRGAAVLLLPSASFAPASEPPLQAIRWAELDFVAGWQSVYNVRAWVVMGRHNGMFLVQVRPLPRAPLTPDMTKMEVRHLGGGRTAYIDEGFTTYVRVTTEHSSISISFDGMLTIEQAIALASAPELDLFS